MMPRDERNIVPSAVAGALARIGVARDELILVALSGGPDSVALLHALLDARERFGYRIAAAHLNHALRGAESDRDEAFVRALCARVGIELTVERAAGLDAHTANLEERAREARHEFLGRIADRIGAAHIALAHHAGDQAETVIMRMLRGAGVAGIGAMAESGPGRLIRPMLTVGRSAILSYLEAIGAGFVEDTSNASMAPLRNRIRHELLPMLEREYAPGAGRRLAALAAEMRAVDEFVEREAERELAAMRHAGGGFVLDRFAALDPALRGPVVRALLRNSTGDLRRIGRAHVDAVVRLVLDGPPNGEVVLPGGWRARREYGRLRIERIARTAQPKFEVPLALDGTTEVRGCGFAFDARLISAPDAPMPPDDRRALFDAGAIGGMSLVVRNFIAGDRIEPLGLGASRKVKEVFIDRKVPRRRRASWPVVTLADEVVWLPGLARGVRALVTPATRVVLRVEARGPWEL
ncbi:MAG TPA: tRNA lysidine(34) synthetase TilS [Acidimicrobiales bacterium]|nr:tRNA lysidine(34) synthetase TilS [Acidimicrobiales bacterium]